MDDEQEKQKTEPAPNNTDEKPGFKDRWLQYSIMLFIALGVISFFIMVGHQGDSIFTWLIWGIGVNILFSAVAGLVISLLLGATNDD